MRSRSREGAIDGEADGSGRCGGGEHRRLDEWRFDEPLDRARETLRLRAVELRVGGAECGAPEEMRDLRALL
jgi:hypothetical protein